MLLYLIKSSMSGTLKRISHFFFFKFLHPKIFLTENSEYMQPHSINSNENVTPLQSTQSGKCNPIQRNIPISLFSITLRNYSPQRLNQKFSFACDADYRITAEIITGSFLFTESSNLVTQSPCLAIW